jgi:hypothetical protein
MSRSRGILPAVNRSICRGWNRVGDSCMGAKAPIPKSLIGTAKAVPFQQVDTSTGRALHEIGTAKDNRAAPGAKAPIPKSLFGTAKAVPSQQVDTSVELQARTSRPVSQICLGQPCCSTRSRRSIFVLGFSLRLCFVRLGSRAERFHLRAHRRSIGRGVHGRLRPEYR